MADDDYQDFSGEAGMDLGGDVGDFGIDDIEQSNIEVSMCQKSPSLFNFMPYFHNFSC